MVWDKYKSELLVSDGNQWLTLLTSGSNPNLFFDEIVLNQQSSTPYDPTGTTKGVMYVKDDVPNTIWYVDNLGVEHNLTEPVPPYNMFYGSYAENVPENIMLGTFGENKWSGGVLAPNGKPGDMCQKWGFTAVGRAILPVAE